MCKRPSNPGDPENFPFDGREWGRLHGNQLQGDESVIRMVSEKIDIRFAKTGSEVHCRFVFRSGKATGDGMQLVGFPDILGHEDYAGVIRKLETFVDDRKVESRKERGWFAAEPFGSPKCGLGKAPPETRPEHVQLADFHVITVTFPPDKDVIIERHYFANNSIDVTGTIWFDYSTHTGAVWRGTIAQADFHVELDGLTLDDHAFEDGPQNFPPRSQFDWCAPNRAEWRIVSPTELMMRSVTGLSPTDAGARLLGAPARVQGRDGHCSADRAARPRPLLASMGG